MVTLLPSPMSINKPFSLHINKVTVWRIGEISEPNYFLIHFHFFIQTKLIQDTDLY